MLTEKSFGKSKKKTSRLTGPLVELRIVNPKSTENGKGLKRIGITISERLIIRLEKKLKPKWKFRWTSHALFISLNILFLSNWILWRRRDNGWKERGAETGGVRRKRKLGVKVGMWNSRRNQQLTGTSWPLCSYFVDELGDADDLTLSIVNWHTENTFRESFRIAGVGVRESDEFLWGCGWTPRSGLTVPPNRVSNV